MEYGNIEQSFKDIQYRKMVREAIDNTKQGLEIIGKNLSCIDYPEILYALRNASKEHLHISIYFNDASQRIVNWLKDSDIEMYKGGKKFSDQDYIIANGSKIILSYTENLHRIGSCKLDMYAAKELVDKFESYKQKEDTQKISSFKESKRVRIKHHFKKPSVDEITKRKKLFENLTLKISGNIMPERISNLEETIRANRERTL